MDKRHTQTHTVAIHGFVSDNCRTRHIFRLIPLTVCFWQDEPVHHSNGERRRQRQERPEGQLDRTAEWYETHPSLFQRCTHTVVRLLNTVGCPSGTTPICDDIGRHILNYGRRIPLAEWDARIDVSLRSELRVLLSGLRCVLFSTLNSLHVSLFRL